MSIVYANQGEKWPSNHIWPFSVFLAGPTPCTSEVPSWRPEFINLIQRELKDITIFVPEQNRNKWQDKYTNQVEWEWNHFQAADIVLFWVPRKLSTMPAFTTNIEFGLMIGMKKNILIGWPPNTPKMEYYKWHLDRLGEKYHQTSEEIVQDLIKKANCFDFSMEDECVRHRRRNSYKYSKKPISQSDFTRSTIEPNP